MQHRTDPLRFGTNSRHRALRVDVAISVLRLLGSQPVPGRDCESLQRHEKMPVCCVVGCVNKKGRDKQFRYFKFPKLRTHEGHEVTALAEERRRLWKAAVNRDLTEERWEKTVTCSKHFVDGMKVYESVNNSYLE